MGGDSAPELFIQEILDQFSSLGPHVQLALIAHPRLKETAGPLTFHPASEIIEMGDAPLQALRKKKDSSLRVGLRLLRDKQLDALISLGNTGALVTGAKAILSTFPHIQRPALAALMPTKKNAVAVLDIGAHLSITADHFVQFAYLGTAYQKTRGIAHPSVGLLNIGSEPSKGTLERRIAYDRLQALSHAPFHFVGNIEGKSAFDGHVDVLLTDGFTGNIFLKTAEGMAGLVLDRFHALASQEERTHLAPLLNDLQNHLYYTNSPGAPLLGIRSLVIKCHGSSTPKALINAIQSAIHLLSHQFVEEFARHLAGV